MRDLPAWIRIEKGNILLNTKHTADFFGVSTRTLTDWVRRGAPKVSRGWWNLRELMTWLGMVPVADDESQASPEARKLLADAEYRELRASRERMKLESLATQLMHRKSIAEEWSLRVNALRSSLKDLAKKIRGKIPDPKTERDIIQALEVEFEELLNQYARPSKYTPKNEPPKRILSADNRAPKAMT